MRILFIYRVIEYDMGSYMDPLLRRYCCCFFPCSTAIAIATAAVVAVDDVVGVVFVSALIPFHFWRGEVGFGCFLHA